MKRIVNKGKGEQPKFDRNVELMNDYKSGKYKSAELVAKYGISQQRIRAIRIAMGVSANKKYKKNKSKVKSSGEGGEL